MCCKLILLSLSATYRNDGQVVFGEFMVCPNPAPSISDVLVFFVFFYGGGGGGGEL